MAKKLRDRERVTIADRFSGEPIVRLYRARVVKTAATNHFDVRYIDRHDAGRVYALRFWYEDEGVRWCRGWASPATDALRAVVALS